MKNNYNHKIKLLFVILISFFGISSFNIISTFAFDVVDGAGSEIGGLGGGGMEINVTDKTSTNVEKKGIINDMKNWLKSFDEAKLLAALKKATAIGYKEALGNFLNQLAADSATYLATGDKGQNPMFETDSIGDYFKNAADNAAGTFLEKLGQNNYLKFNLCNPIDPSVMIKITLGLQKSERPDKPACTFSKMTANWDKALQDPNFLNNFQDMFNPWSNDLGIALTLHTGIIAEKQSAEDFAGIGRIINQGVKDVVDPISGKIKTPAGIVDAVTKKGIDDANANYFVYTGDAVADAISVFINTLMGKFIDKWLKEGLVTDFPDNSYDWSKLGTAESSAGKNSANSAKERFKTFVEPSFSARGDYDILAELMSCPNPTKAGPTNCVITDKFRQAVINRMTVGEAMKQGYLNANGVFGFTADGLEPPYNEAYPYRSMIILRKFRILPAGWEVSAQYIKENSDKVDGTKNLGDLVACFSSSDDYAGYFANWCEGLVDPTWVLKAPLNYCKQEGPGPEIISEQIVGSGADSEIAISRNDNYCGDEQSCIKENEDGSCQLYGYCAEERRKWDFSGKSCDAKYNTCESFKSSDGKAVAYLENTLDFGNCTADNAGCGSYCEDLKNGKWDCTADTGNKIYLDNGAEACDADAEGCHEFIRTNGTGANLLINSSFEDNLAGTIWEGKGAKAGDGFDGASSLQLSGDLTLDVKVGPDGYKIGGQTYTLSFYAKNCGNGGNFGIETNASPLSTSAGWQQYSLTNVYAKEALGNIVKINIKGFGASCSIDAIKLEAGNRTAYDNYRVSGIVYEKLAPAYLGCDGENDLAECAKFARMCSADEAGCELYTSQSDNISVPAKVIAQDYCPAQCVGYDTYVQKETAFDSLRDNYFIPQTAKSCNATAVGCDEFTNLDKAEQGGEAREYYTYLKQCVKPNDPGANCAEFYTWEGSDETGYQLRVFELNQNVADHTPYVASVTELYNEKECNGEEDYNPNVNPMCRQFYNTSGGVSYRFYPYTVACSNDCHPYRRTENNVDPKIAQADCVGANKHWDAASNSCHSCKGAGIWDNEHNACLYNAIPGEGQTCSAPEAGCREYAGNTGNNTRIVLNNNFEGSAQNWSGVNATAVAVQSNALIAGGNSLRAQGGSPVAIKLVVSQSVSRGNAYALRFLAKAEAGAVKLTANFSSGLTTSVSFLGSAGLNASEWRVYELNLTELNHAVGAGETLTISGTGNFYIDDIRLTEISDRYYMIKNSWNTPSACLKDTLGNAVDEFYNLGCDAYSDRAKKTHYLRKFDHLCSDSAVGCELMIDTHNSSDYKSIAGDEPIPADNFVYATYAKDKECGREDKGCQRLGDSYEYENTILFKDVYLKNDPDKYSGADSILCSSGAVGCEAWTTQDGASYFKDPGDEVCEWRQIEGVASGSWNWLKKKINRCDGTGNVCLANTDCVAGVACKTETANIACPTSSLKTFGIGGTGNKINQPTSGWAGICPASASACTEYIDPTSRFSSNAIFNSDFSQDVDGNLMPDGWNAGSQTIVLEPNTLYIISVEGNNEIKVKANHSLYILGNNNALTGPVSEVSISSAGERKSKTFYVSENISGNVSVAVDNFGGVAGSKVEVKKATIDYQNRRNLDKKICNGVVNFEEGCVLFNERAQNGSSLGSLNWDADLTINDENGKSPLAGVESERDSNSLIKVSPDRVCNEWLACRSMVAVKDNAGTEKNVCFDVGLCDSVDNNGDCDNFALENKGEQKADLPGDFSKYDNASGYTKVGLNGIKNNNMKGLYQFGEMDQEGEMVGIPNGNFESSGDNGYPIGWNRGDGKPWEKNAFRAIDNPIEAQVEGIDRAPEGKGFLKIGTVAPASSELLDVIPGTPYVLTAYVNTINLSSGSAKIKLEQFKSDGKTLVGAADDIVVYNSGQDWNFQLVGFTTRALVYRIKITVFANSNTVGNSYFDDIKIGSALNTRMEGANKWYSAQSCRLYPEDDALSCDYFDDSGKRHKGWPGYCLEYDRYPGSPDACLMWWPVDRVKGDGLDEGAGYLGRTPVYYCLEATGVCGGDSGLELKYYCTKIVQAVSSAGQNKFWAGRVYEGSNYEIPFASSVSGAYIQWAAGNKENVVINYSRGGAPFGSIVPPEPVNNPYEWDSDANTIETEPIYVFDQRTTINGAYAGTPYYGKDKTCSRSEQVNNFQYFTHEGGGDDHWLYCPAGMTRTNWWECGNGSNHGSNAVPNGCYAWERENNKGSECCGITCEMKGVFKIASTPEEAVRGIQRIFAQSYGVWQWFGNETDGQYKEVGGNWMAPEAICPIAGRPVPPAPGDLCAVLPVVSNIKANSSVANIEIKENQFINLTFNSKVDSQQLPLTMYAIDWGDNEKTVVSGVEMRDRANAESPHSLYHLYNYWDLKAKDSQAGPNDILCGDNCKGDGQCALYSGAYCRIKPKIQIKDNWGWCNGGGAINDCDQTTDFGAFIVVTEE